MTDPKNPFFAKAVANRYWAHFFGRGIVDPLDDMRVTNPPSNPELLDALAKNLVDNKYSLKALVKTICKSRTYQLQLDAERVQRGATSSRTPATTRSGCRPRWCSTRWPGDATARAAFPGLPTDRFAPSRAIMLPDESFASYFLDVFGRPQRISACECERVNEASLAMSLHLLNSEEVQDKITRAGGRAEPLAKDPRPDAEKVEELFLWAIGKQADPGAAEDWPWSTSPSTRRARRAAYENILWALLNSKAFLFNQ